MALTARIGKRGKATGKTKTKTKTKDSARTMSSDSQRAVKLARVLLILSTLTLVLLGLVMVYSASAPTALRDTGDTAHFLKMEALYAVLGCAAAAVVAFIPLDFWRGRVVWVIVVLLILMLIAVRLFGNSGDTGAQRWITVGGQRMQPSEFAKIGVLLPLATILVRWREGSLSVRQLLVRLFVAVVIPSVLVLFQPDLGTTVVLGVMVIAVLMLGEVDGRIIGCVCGALILCGAAGTLLVPYRRARLEILLDPFGHINGNGYQVVHAFYAFATGGLTGTGLGLSRQKYFYLPEAHNDFIFAVIGEELGLLGACFVIALFLVYIYAGLRIAERATSRFGSLIAGGATAAIGFQAFLNMACAVGLFPVTGKPLPFVSYGGSSMVASMILTGFILSVSREGNPNAEAQRRRKRFRVIEGSSPARNSRRTARS